MTKQITDANVFAESYLTALFQRLNELNIQFCVLHSYHQLPEYVRSDVDFVIEKRGIKLLDHIVGEAARDTGARFIQKVHHGIPSYYNYDLAYTAGTSVPQFIKLDFHYDKHGIGRDYMPTSILLSNRRVYRNFYVSDAPIEMIHLLLKRTIKGKLEKHHKLRIEQLYRDNHPNTTKLLVKYLGKRTSREFETSMKDSNWETFCSHMAKHQRRVWFRKLRNNNVWYITQSFALHLVRAAKRIIHPVGMFVVLVGPDGSGKTCVGDALCEQMLHGFRRTTHIHWRPGLLPRLRTLLHSQNGLEEDYTQPHSALPYGNFLSLSKFAYYTADFILGYWLKIRMLKVKSTLVVIDRYYYDYLVDTQRYRLKLPQWLIRAVMKVIPKPDMVVYLHNSPEKLHERKQELTMEELTRQTRAFQKILPELPNAYIIETDKSLDEVVNDVSSIALARLEQRIKERMR